MNDSGRMALLLSLRAAVWQPNDYCHSGAGNRCECGSSHVTSSPGAGSPYCGSRTSPRKLRKAVRPAGWSAQHLETAW